MSSILNLIPTSARVNDEEHDVESSLTFSRQLGCPPVLKVVSRLVRAVQHHRGATIACLGGDSSYYPQVARLQNQIERLLLLLVQLNQTNNTLIAAEVVTDIINDWYAIHTGWKDDGVIQNFEFHSHLIETLQQKVLGAGLELIEAENEFADSRLSQLLPVILKEIPGNVELLAKLRGLSVHSAVIKHCDSDTHVRLGFMTKKVRTDYKNLLHTLDKSGQIRSDIKAIAAIQGHQVKVEFMLDYINKTIVDSEDIEADSETIFKSLTQVIDIYWDAVDQGLLLLEELVLSTTLNWVEEVIK